MAVERNISPADDFFTGEDKTLPITIYQANGTTAQNITGWNLSWLVKRKRLDLDVAAVVTKVTPTGITLTTPLSGLCTVTVTDEDIATLSADTLYYHELKRTDVGSETVLTFGTFRLRQAVHR